ncbi:MULTISPECIES: S24/S26 family peptidase [Microbacterium]|uniref:S24/S26 family peptidase n=1 Tax=Microbacterium TaxID=33882 RepID=UPI0022F06AFD|nr:S24/S26 family peptidase [Streptomyces sp. MS2A]
MRALLITVRALVWAALIALSAPFFWQLTTGGATLAVNGTSMVPTYERGDVVFLDRVEDPGTDFWKPGQIVAVAFSASNPDHDRYIHRVDSVLDDGRAVLKGDGNPEPDVSPVSLDQVVGVPVTVLHQPAADIYLFTQSWLGRIVIFGVGISVLVLVEHVAKRRRNSGFPMPEGL